MNLASTRVCLALMCVMVALCSATAEARPKLTRSILKTYFETGDRPTQQQFATLIDSMIHVNEDRQLLGLHVYGNEGTRVRRLRAGTIIPTGTEPDGSHYALPTPSSLLQMAPDFAGESGFAALLYGDTTGQHYHAFLQVSMDPVAPTDFVDSPGIHVAYLVMETTANTTFETFFVPEPVTMSGTLLLATTLLRRRR